VVIKTNHGTIKVELFEKEAPETVKNFLKYVDDEHYDGTVFHRVIEDFMIQGGNFKKGFSKVKNEKDLEKLSKKTKDPIKNESDNGLSNKRGTLAMARTNKPNSATDQFFINNKDNDFLDRAKAKDKVGYCVFGKVTEGMDVVDKIKKVKTMDILDGDMENVPVEDVVIESIRREGK
jgi:cyclophilin family peptidyl-prolyl cis-trans isomerase